MQLRQGSTIRMILLSGVVTLCLACLAAAATTPSPAEMKDTREGEDVRLSCRFPPQLAQQNPTYFWLRTNTHKHDNVAVGSTPLGSSYSLDFQPAEGRYDLHIKNVSYERDNGRFECRVKAQGSGLDLHSQVVELTVLTPPRPPTVSPGLRAVATEGKPQQLNCSSTGGSPDPNITWYKEGYPLEAEIVPGTFRDVPTTAILTVNASRTDDGAAYRCVVWNRAMSAGTKLETTVTLSVNYFPRVDVGRENPVRVERDGTATLKCTVDAKPAVNNVRWTRNGRFVATDFTHTINRVSVQDAGKYVCSADNGLGQVGEAELTLDVLFPPRVTIEGSLGASKTREVEESESVTVHCNVTANPKPHLVEWLREGHPEFRQSGPILSLPRVTADAAGTYICRAVNALDLSIHPRRRFEPVGNASIVLLVRHKPGLARISPDKPVGTEGAGVTLSCSSNPPGWPAPQYRWWRDPIDQTGSSPNNPETVIATGPKYTIHSAHLGSEGTYHCQASNEMGQGEAASVLLEVHQPPHFLAKLQPLVVRKDGVDDFTAMCGAQGKPKPSIRWLKDGREIGPGTPGAGYYDISTDESEGSNSVFSVQSILKYVGVDRRGGNQLEPSDRGVYTCVFENQVKKAESTMHLNIEHAPIILNRYNKVAYDLREDAQVVCRVQAYPRPEFQWSYGNNQAALLTSSDGHYEITTTAESNGDIFTSVLKVSSIRDVDYGEYTCRANNGQGAKREVIKLQPKGPPEAPQALKTTAIGHNFVTLLWEAGFDGGVQNTKYFVAYRRVSGTSGSETDGLASDCYSAAPPSVNANLVSPDSSEGWQEFDCQRNNPCNVSSLEQHASYLFKVKAYNTKGHSNYSDTVSNLTKVDSIPAPQLVTYDPDSHSLSINIAATCLQLVGQVEASLGIVTDSTGREMEEWHLVETLSIQASGSAATRREATIQSLIGGKQPMPMEGTYRSSGRSLGNDYENGITEEDFNVEHSHTSQTDPRVRVKLCLRSNPDTCGDYTEAEVGPAYSLKEASVLATPTLIAIVVSCVVFILFVGLLFMFCRCKRHQNKKAGGKNYEMNSSNVGPSMVTQPPPPYYPSSGLENKALEHSLDLALDDGTKGHHVYAAQNGYGYHGALPGHQHHGPPQTHGINGGEWVNMGYMENSYSNSNNGGSVNSQDSLWQMKMAAAASNNGSQTGVPSMNDPQNQFQHSHPNLHTHGSSYGYDPLSHGGYGAVDDYAAYPQQPGDMDYGHHLNQGRNSANPSRQEYAPSGDPYAAVQKPRRRMDQHIDSPYHDVSGLPDPYMDQMESDEKQPPHMGMPYDESLESGYSTPNSRNRRVIREIIV